MIRPERLGHAVIKVRDLDRSRQFYTEVLGMQIMKDVPEIRAVFLANHGRDHHELALFEIGSEAEAPNHKAVGLAHIAFRLTTQEELEAAYHELKEKGVPVHFTVNHGITKSVYFEDPDGYELEVYCDNDPAEYVRYPNAYLGLEKLDYAAQDKGLRDIIPALRQ